MNLQSDRDLKPRRLGHLLAILRERYWIVVLCLVIGGGAALGVSFVLSPRYSATAQLAYSARNAQLASQALTSSGTPALTHNISSDALTLQTSAFAGRVSQAIKTHPDAEKLRASIQVTSDPVADAIEVKAEGSDPQEVATTANTFASEFVKERQEKTQESLTEAQHLVQARIDSLSADEAGSARGLALKQQLDDLTSLLSMQIKDYEVIQEAMVPASPYSPKPVRNLLIGLGAGLLLGLVLALILGYADRRIKDRATLEAVMDLPVLGTMPLPPAKRGRTSAASAVGFTQGRESSLESIRMLRSNLKVLGFGESKRSVLITSTAPGEGKSSLAVNLTLGMALSGDRVILVDADLRNPMIHLCLGIPNEQGLGDVLLLEKDASWSRRLQAVDLAPFLDPRMSLARKPAGKEAAVSKFLCLTSGTLPANPTEILESEAMMDVLGELQGISDYVILDGPPMLVASDSLILAQSVDAVILASTLGKETAAEATQVRQLLARAEIPVLGIVVCGSKGLSREAYYYHPNR